MAKDKRDGEGQAASPQQASSDTTSSDTTAVAPGTADEFRSFMVALATDPAKLGAFIKDPDGSMAAANIDPVDQVILKSGQPWTIHARLLGQKFSFAPPAPTPTPTVLVVDMTRQTGAGGSDETEQPTVRSGTVFTASANQGSLNMFPQQVFPQVHPQQVFPQVHPQQIFPQVHPQQVFPQVHPQQIFPQVHPQQIFPQIHPQQIFPQIHPPVFPNPGPQHG